MPTTIFGVFIPLVVTLIRERIKVVEAKEKRPLRASTGVS